MSDADRIKSAISDVRVVRQASGRLRVSWEADGDLEAVEIAWGRSPEGLDHERAVTLPASVCSAVVEPPGPRQRVYVSLSAAGQPGAVVAGERNVGMSGPVNFRDLGGYRTSEGRAVRWGTIFRSDALRLTDSDLEDFDGLGIRTVYDLRSPVERNDNPSRLPERHPPDVELVPLIDETPVSSRVGDLSSGDGESFLERVYMLILESSAPAIARIMDGLARAERLPAVFHCSAGKDRTGMVAAVLLSILGVPESVVLDDYELTTEYRTAEHVKASMRRLSAVEEVPAAARAGIIATPRWALQSALAEMQRRFGGFEGYLTGPGGADPAVPGELRRMLLTP